MSVFSRFRRAVFGGLPPEVFVASSEPVEKSMGTYASLQDAALNLAIRNGSMPVTVQPRIKLIEANPVAFQCVRKIAWSAGSVPWLVNGKDNGDLHELLNGSGDPADPTRHAIWTQAAQSLAVCGFAMLKKTRSATGKRKASALHFLRPDRVHVQEDPSTGEIDHYLYQPKGGASKKLTVEEVIHIQHPWLVDDDWTGISVVNPLFDVLMMWEGYNKLKRKLLENSGGIPMALVFSGEQGLSDKQRQEINAIFEDFRLDGSNFGKILTLDAGVFKGRVEKIPLAGDIAQLDPSATMADLERQICNMFGVPRLLLGVGGDTTYANQKEARRYFWLDTVVTGYLKPIAKALSQAFGEEITPDLDDVPALADFRGEVAQQLGSSDYLTDNEKRAVLGYERYDVKMKDASGQEQDRGPADVIYKSASLIPVEAPASAPQAGTQAEFDFGGAETGGDLGSGQPADLPDELMFPEEENDQKIAQLPVTMKRRKQRKLA